MRLRQKLLDSEGERLLYLDCEVNEKFWDQKWAQTAKNTFANPPRHRSTINTTKRYLPIGSRILEGGCGLGDVVLALHKAGYRAEGVDYAPKVVDEINQNWPDLNVKQGDVRYLDVANDYYDGYWSIGVIEHFPLGFGEIAEEMARVIKSGGYLFLSFPSLNIFRQRRAKLGKYKKSAIAANDIENFFQFALAPEKVEHYFHGLGFVTVDIRGLDALKCLAEDLPLFLIIHSLLDRFPSRISSGISILIDRLIGKYAGHSCLLILRKN